LHKKAPAHARGESLPKQAGGCVESEGHQAASFSAGMDEISGHTSIQLVRKC
jgi:hypothetical protein